MTPSPLLSLGLGLAGAVVGLFIGFAPSPEAASFRRARRATSGDLHEGDFVLLQGALTAQEPLLGAISQDSVGVQRLMHHQHGQNAMPQDHDRRDVSAQELQVALGLAVRDDLGTVLINPEEGMLYTRHGSSGTEQNLGARWNSVAPAETLRLFERSIPIGAPVVVIGEATWNGTAWAVRGRDLLLSDFSREALESRFASGRVLGIAVITLSILGGVGAAIAQRWP